LWLGQGKSIGWVGGGCVHTAIEREAALALADAAPRLVRLSSTPREEDGVVNYPMTCHSGGTLEIYLEPVLPAPELVILGESPVAETLASLAEPLGFRILASLDDVTTSDVWVVTAAMSDDEDHSAVSQALARGVPYVAMVASRRRTEALLSELRAEGHAEEMIARLKAPAGLDIGAANSAEIALSILAEIVQRRRAARASPVVQAPAALAIDPVCGMKVDVKAAERVGQTAEKDGQTYYFCAAACRRAFLAV
jgi:xanthine dehydrogenase accessory factor